MIILLLLPFLMFSDYHDTEVIGVFHHFLELLTMAKLNILNLTGTTYFVKNYFVENHKVDLEFNLTWFHLTNK